MPPPAFAGVGFDLIPPVRAAAGFEERPGGSAETGFDVRPPLSALAEFEIDHEPIAPHSGATRRRSTARMPAPFPDTSPAPPPVHSRRGFVSHNFRRIGRVPAERQVHRARAIILEMNRPNQAARAPVQPLVGRPRSRVSMPRPRRDSPALPAVAPVLVALFSEGEADTQVLRRNGISPSAHFDATDPCAVRVPPRPNRRGDRRFAHPRSTRASGSRSGMSFVTARLTSCRHRGSEPDGRCPRDAAHPNLFPPLDLSRSRSRRPPTTQRRRVRV